MYDETNNYSNEVEEEITETKESVDNILEVKEVIIEPIKAEEIVKAITNSIAIRMTSGYKGRKSGDDYLVTKKELKAIPKFKYKLI